MNTLNAIPATNSLTNPDILLILQHIFKNILIAFCLNKPISPTVLFQNNVFLLCVLYAYFSTCDPAQPYISRCFKLMGEPCVTRASAAVNSVITQKDLYGVGCGEGCRSRLRKCLCVRER